MTRGDIITVLRNARDLLIDEEYHYTASELNKVIEILDTPSLDTACIGVAAKTYYEENGRNLGGIAEIVDGKSDIWYPSEAIKKSFEAGAVWEANQGETVDGIIAKLEYVKQVIIENDKIDFSKYDNTERVTVQIRKK